MLSFKNQWHVTVVNTFYNYLCFLRHLLYSSMKISYFFNTCFDLLNRLRFTKKYKKYIFSGTRKRDRQKLETFTSLYTNTANIIRVILYTVGLSN